MTTTQKFPSLVVGQRLKELGEGDEEAGDEAGEDGGHEGDDEAQQLYQGLKGQGATLARFNV